MAKTNEPITNEPITKETSSKTLHSSSHPPLPVLATKDIIAFPNTICTIFVIREISINTMNLAYQNGKELIVLLEKDPEVKEICKDNLHTLGTHCRILHKTRLPNDHFKIIVEGIRRVKIDRILHSHDLMQATYKVPRERRLKHPSIIPLTIDMLDLFNQVLKEHPKIFAEPFKKITSTSTNVSVDTLAANIPLISLSQKFAILSTLDIVKRTQLLNHELGIIVKAQNLEEDITAKVKNHIEKTQREYFLNEKIKVIRKELGEDDTIDELQELKHKINSSDLPEHARIKAEHEFKRLKNTPQQSPENTIIRNYLDTLLKLPWNTHSPLQQNINIAEKILDSDHYGLDEVKQRILEQIAVQQRTKKNNGVILCLVGPPGVGKTSLAESIANATGREYVRMALGGVRDEAEIRGHRRTYIGSMSGKILQKISQAGVNNPLFLLDEIDKMAMDFRGDPASALLEVLDPEQNHTFSDHYLEIDFDLSNVYFLATSNSYNIPPALLDRMEIIELSGYTDHEKQHISKDYILPKQKNKHGIQKNELSIQKQSIPFIIENYTREAGVRQLERQIAKICRKTVLRSLSQSTPKTTILTKKNIRDILGTPVYSYNDISNKDRIGQVNGLAWNQVGGDLLTIECTIYPGKGRLTSTGKLGEVMQESAQTALSVIKNNYQHLGIDTSIFEKHDIHLHVPEGATPKEGPSAGMAITIALASCFSEKPARANVAMTGEITLRGDILPIGGLKQKLLAASRSKIKTVLIPEKNQHNLEEIPDEIKDKLNIIQVSHIDQAFGHTLCTPNP